MRELLDDDLAELYPVRQTEEDLRLAKMRERLFAQPRPRRVPRWVGVAAAAVAVLLIAGVVVFVRPVKQETQVATMPVAPATSLLEAAAMLEVSAEPLGRFRHVRYQSWVTATTGDLGTAGWGATQFEWQTDVYLPVEKGQNPVSHTRLTGNHRPVAGVQKTAELLERQEDQQGPELWTTLCTHTPCHEVNLLMPLSGDAKFKLQSAKTTLTSPYTTNQEKAALYRQLATDPAVRWENGTVSMEGGMTTLRIDPATGEVAGFSDRDPYPPTGTHVPPDIVTLEVSITYGWTDQRPS
ncbi:hypothetical protein BBK82_46380 [Lentzea guizhouensis]|uniref:Uncharacterized protein n=1 Tax=Lentzea guizhouensis TaxID=1586287 RepID=A0A1B2HX37_9PSEU|nr:hypothetical protein [Lentzea guizhouensis]ANZ42261.1 hypothetical protein BBK82_46380 [Lentzea guizhouensis]